MTLLIKFDEYDLVARERLAVPASLQADKGAVRERFTQCGALSNGQTQCSGVGAYAVIGPMRVFAQVRTSRLKAFVFIAATVFPRPALSIPEFNPSPQNWTYQTSQK